MQQIRSYLVHTGRTAKVMVKAALTRSAKLLRHAERVSGLARACLFDDYLRYQSRPRTCGACGGVDVRQLSTSPQLSAWPIGVGDIVQPP
jgi:hypothetical protein